jgi:hypothetical protein
VARSSNGARARSRAALVLALAGAAGGCSFATVRSRPRWAGADGVLRCDSVLVPAVDAGIGTVLVTAGIGRLAIPTDTPDTEVPTAALVAGSAVLASALYGVIAVRRCERSSAPAALAIGGQGAQVSATRWPLLPASERPTTK